MSVFSTPRPDPRQLTRSGEPALLALDTVNGKPVGTATTIGLDSAGVDTLTLNGWAVDHVAGKAAGGVFLSVGGRDIPAHDGLERKDVADRHGNPAYLFSGFSASFALDVLGRGRHTAIFEVLTADGTAYYQSTPFTLEIT